MKFAHLTTQSHSSFLQAVGTADELVQKAKAMGQEAIGITDISSMSEIFDLHRACEQHGLNPVFGCKIYVCRDMSARPLLAADKNELLSEVPLHEREVALRLHADANNLPRHKGDYGTLNLWAVNDEGRKNIQHLLRQAQEFGKYYVPRIDLAALIARQEGIAVGLDGDVGYVHREHINGDFEQATKYAEQIYKVFGERTLLEIRPHLDPNQDAVNSFCQILAERMPSARLVATHRTLYVDQEDHETQRAMAAIGEKGGSIDDSGVPVNDFWMRTPAEMLEAFSTCRIPQQVAEDAMLAAHDFALSCSASIEEDKNALIIPSITPDDDDALRQRAEEGLRLRGLDRSPEYVERMHHELDVLAEMKFSSYIMFTSEFVAMVNAHGIDVAPGRGSAAGSLVNLLTSITKVDPIKFGLLFERFVDPGRIAPPDIDLDVDGARRDDGIALCAKRWGHDHVAKICTFTILRAKSAIQDMARVLKVPKSVEIEVCKYFPDASKVTLKEGLQEYARLRELAEQHPQLFDLAQKIEGRKRGIGVHAGGFIVTPQPVTDYGPVHYQEGKGAVIAVDMSAVEAMGILKIDFLGVNVVKMLSMCRERINRAHPGFSLDTIPLDDPKTIQAFSAGKFDGIFQFETPSAKQNFQGAPFTRFEDVAAYSALNRPGTLDSGMTQQFLSRQRGDTEVGVDYCQSVSEITSETNGVMVYQEQLMQVFASVGKHQRPDDIRRKIGKKIGIDDERTAFLAAAAETEPDMSRQTAEKLFSDMQKFGLYGFNKSHSIAYGLQSYHQQWIKEHHPAIFYWASILCASTEEKKKRVSRTAEGDGVTIETLSVQHSGLELDVIPGRNSIAPALTDIKGVGVKAVESIVSQQPFDDFSDFRDRTDPRYVNAGVLKALAASGALEGLIPHQKHFVENVKEILHQHSLKRNEQSWSELLASDDDDDYTKSERVLMQLQLCPTYIGDPFEREVGQLNLDLADLSDLDFMRDHDGQAVWVYGSVSEIHTFLNSEPPGRDPWPEHRRAHHSYGAEMARLRIQGVHGGDIRVKIPPGRWRYEKDRVAEANHVLALVTPSAQYGSCDLEILVPMQCLDERNTFSASARLGHPILRKELSAENANLIKANIPRYIQEVKDEEFDLMYVIGMVTGIRMLATKRGQEMAFVRFWLPNASEVIEASVFPRDWDDLQRTIRLGATFRVGLKHSIYQGKDSWALQGKTVRKL